MSSLTSSCYNNNHDAGHSGSLNNIAPYSLSEFYGWYYKALTTPGSTYSMSAAALSLSSQPNYGQVGWSAPYSTYPEIRIEVRGDTQYTDSGSISYTDLAPGTGVGVSCSGPGHITGSSDPSYVAASCLSGADVTQNNSVNCTVDPVYSYV